MVKIGDRVWLKPRYYNSGLDEESYKIVNRIGTISSFHHDNQVVEVLWEDGDISKVLLGNLRREEIIHYM